MSTESYCCDRFKEEYEKGHIEEDTDDDTDRPTGKYGTTCCCGPGGILICRDIEFCCWCGARINYDNSIWRLYRIMYSQNYSK